MSLTSLSSSLGQFPGYLDWLWYPGLPPELVSIAFSPSPSISRCFPFSLLHLPLGFIRVSSSRPTYLHPLVNLSLTHFLGEFPGLRLALVPDVVVTEVYPSRS